MKSDTTYDPKGQGRNGLELNALISLKLYEDIFGSSPFNMLITDAKPNGQMPDILYVNDAFCKATGYSREELIGKQPSLLTGPESDLMELVRLGEAIQMLIPADFEMINYKKNGGKFWNKFSLIPIKNEYGIYTHWVAHGRDITEEKTQKNLLEESERKFRNLVENSSVGIYIINSKGFVFVNETFVSLTGFTAEELYSNSIEKLVFPEDREMVNIKIQSRLNGGGGDAQYELRIVKKTGEIQTFEAHGTRTIFRGEAAVIGTVTDITQRKLSEEKIRKFSQVIQQSGASIMITDLDGKIEYVNPAFTEVTGYTFEEALGQNPKILKTNFTPELTHQKLWVQLVNNKGWKGTFCNQKKNGEYYWEEANISPVFNEEGIKINYVAVKEDISSRILLEEEKEKLIEELTLSYNELKQFSYITSHNLRAPLTNLMGILDLLDLSKIEDETVLLLMEAFKKSTHKLDETLHDLIKTLVVKENTSRELILVSFRDIFEKTIHGLDILIKKSRTVFDVHFEEAPQCQLIKTYIESIFQNLITNSIKYSQPGLDPHIIIRTKNEGDKIVFIFSDNGLGMDLNKIKDRLFGLYQKFHKNDDSKGIGLYLVKSHILAMRGEINVESQINKGTTFTIKFEQ